MAAISLPVLSPRGRALLGDAMLCRGLRGEAPVPMAENRCQCEPCQFERSVLGSVQGLVRFLGLDEGQRVARGA